MKSIFSLKYFVKKSFVIHPVLFAIVPILFLYTHNISETSADRIWTPIGISVAFALVLWAILSLILRNILKAALATTLFLFFFYGHLYELIEMWDVFIPKHALLPSVLFFWGYCVYFISLAKRDFRPTTAVLNIVAAVLIAINLANISIYEITKPRLTANEPVKAASSENLISGGVVSMPDIYFIILDEYAHPDTMREWADYDNSRFIKDLEDRGFYIASQSRTRVPNSDEVLAQLLNMEYLTEGYYWDESQRRFVERTSGALKTWGDKAWRNMLYQKIVDNKVTDFLKSKGYKYVFFGSWYEVDRYQSGIKDNAYLYFNCYESDSNSIVSEFQDILWKTTLLKPLYQFFAGDHYETYYRRGVLDTLEHLKKMPSVEGPKFIFAHFICPHPPFVFGPRGEFVSSANYGNFNDKQFYRGQYIFITREIERLVDALLQESVREPIIILQSDHGIRPHYTGIEEIGKDEWCKILNAMYLPGLDKTVLYDSISPVNTFRLIFNHYFGADYPLLED